MKNGSERVVITGLGVVSPAGVGVSEFLDSIQNGGREAALVSLFDVSDFAVRQAKEVPELDAKSYLGKKGLRYLDRSTVFSLIATQLAMAQRGKDIPEMELKEAGVVLGTAFGGLHSIGSFDRDSLDNPNYINPMDFPNTVINSPASQMSVRFGMERLNLTISTGQSAGVDAIGYGAERIQTGQAQMIFAGGVEELSLELFAACHQNDLLRKTAGAPGLILGEGAGIVILEALNEERHNPDTIIAEVAGYGTACDAGFKMSRQEAPGACRAMLLALEDAGIAPESVDAVITCQNGLKEYDEMEEAALKRVFGDRLNSLEVFSVKQVIGEAMGAAGALQVVFASLLLKHGLLVHDDWIEQRFRQDADKTPDNRKTIMVNSFSCNGVHSSLLLKKYQ